MLMQSFKTAKELHLSEPQVDALRKTLVMMETQQIEFIPYGKVGILTEAYSGPVGNQRFCGKFNMAGSFMEMECGTAGCIRGTAMMISKVYLPTTGGSQGFTDLCYNWIGDPNVEQAARALRNYLTYGEPQWKQVMYGDQ